MSASRVLGHGYGASLRQIILPLLKSSFLAGLMLVFADIMKELPMTLLLRHLILKLWQRIPINLPRMRCLNGPHCQPL